MAKAGLLYVGADDGVVLYSEPGATGRWFRVGHELRGRSVQSIWTAVENPLVVLAWAGTSLVRSADGGMRWSELNEPPGGFLAGSKAMASAVVCVTPDGVVWRSDDLGEHWHMVGGILPPVLALANVPATTTTLIAVSGQTIQSSTDGGTTWSQLGDTLAGQIGGVTSTASADAVFATSSGKLYTISSTGWQSLPDAPPAAGAVAMLPGQAPTLLAALSGGGIGRSPDNGRSWEHAGSELGWNTTPAVIVAAPYHMDVAFAGGDSIAISTDRGRSWTPLKGEIPHVRAISAARLV